MLTKGDEYPIHQVPEPIVYAGSDRNFYDRYFFNGYSMTEEEFFAMALGVYSNLNIMDASFSVIKNGIQHNLRASKHLGMERMDTEFEPDGMTQKKLHFRIEDVDGFRMNVTGQVFNVFHFTFKEDEKHTIVNEGLTEYCWEGKKSFGISEYLHRLS